MKGGYQIIDLSKDPFISGTPKTVKDAFEKVTSLNGRKAILLEGLSLKASSLADPILKNAEWADFSGDSSSVSATLADGTTVAITNADIVTITLS